MEVLRRAVSVRTSVGAGPYSPYMGTMERQTRGDLAGEFAEDLATRWIPDVLADFDIDEAVRFPYIGEQDVRYVFVPRVSGGVRRAPVLSGSALGAIREAVEPVRRVSDDILQPSVCGYRVGATGDVSYSDEYRRFRSFAEALSDESAWVVVADVKNFFDSVSVRAMQVALEGDFDEAIEPVKDLMGRFASRGLTGLPAGYGDARLLANALLSPVDNALNVPFTRWIDDYRLFASTRAEAERAIRTLSDGLARLGLELNDSKLAVMTSLEYRRRRHGVQLDSVYHPQDEPTEAVRAGLRSVFVDAISERDRRRLRFVLPRLAQQGDPVAVEYALTALRSNSIDAPRMVNYLSAFVGEPTLTSQIVTVASTAATSDWILMRLAPLLFRVELDQYSIAAIVGRLQQTDSTLLWGLLVRLLAVHQRADELGPIFQTGPLPDYRAVVGAHADLGIDVDVSWLVKAPSTVRALESSGRAPLPKAESLL